MGAGADSTPGSSLRVTQVRSTIGTNPKHRGTLRALGLRGVGQSHVLPDRPEIRGMLRGVAHLVRVEATDDLPSPARRRAGRPAVGTDDAKEATR